MPGARVVVGSHGTVEEYVLEVLNLIASGVEEVEVAASSDNACMLADVVRRVIEESGGGVEQAGGSVRFERRRPGGRGRVVVTVRLRPRPV